MKQVFLCSLIVGVVLTWHGASAQGLSAGHAVPVAGTQAPHGLLIVASQPGDLDGDGDVDNDDLKLLLAELNMPVSGSTCGAPCDLNGDGVINALDSRLLVALCTRPRCGTE